ncbi:type II RES/Xre toxin-antitoxin system antitoxin [Zunongwangia profunda]|uniref:type II RES/Xre toxin-antitoxin system antitoxin n=2 Tax=Zunongwangia profunda TaxID=398743 RepID=UPI001D186212|nr:antitoxin Xre/MbcA/ParS toxin-binding domain-containing protein [Zunongwangia profunda]MCC4228966.1 MbcA/ParS/Xre antitoxin family protein [Zunongwangia profunda]
MPVKKKSDNKSFDPKRSVKRARAVRKVKNQSWTIETSDRSYVWSSRMERVSIIRKGLPYESIEFISNKSNLPIKHILHLLQMPQTTYNKKKKDKDLLSGRDSELVLVLTEVLEFGLEVFNSEKEKFQRWLQKTNISLGGAAPISLFDSLTGIQEVRNSLNRLEYGNLA